MKTFYLIWSAFLAFMLSVLMPAVAQTPSFAWARMATTSNQASGRAITTDAAGNSYVTGYFSGTSTFGSTTLSSSGQEDIFTVKYNTSGVVAWAVKGGGTSFDQGRGIAVDGSGNCYVTGYFLGTATFGTTTLTSTGSQDMFIVKYNTSGAVVWAVKAGGLLGDEGYSIAVDGNGNSYVTGEFQGTAIFGNTTLISNGSYEMFTVKYDASGTVVWAVKGSSIGQNRGMGIALDSSGSSYVTGMFEDTITFGTTSLISTGGQDMFIVKYDASGAVVWAVQGGGSGTEMGLGIAVDGSGNSYVTGNFSGTATFGTTPITSSGNQDMFIVKYSPSGAVVWAVKGGGASFDSGSSIAVDGSGNSYVSGNFAGTAAFGTTTLTSFGNQDMFIVKYSSSGAVIWAVKGGGGNHDYCSMIALDGSGNSYITGKFSGSANFGIILLNTNAWETMFIAKLGSGTTTGVTAMNLPAKVSISPNPNSGIFNLEIKGFRQNEAILIAYDVTGKQVLSKAVTAENGSIAEKLQLPDQKGIYLLKIVSANQVLTRKVMVE